MSSSQVGKGEDASTPMLSGGAGQAHVIRMDPNTNNFQSTVSEILSVTTDRTSGFFLFADTVFSISFLQIDSLEASRCTLGNA